MINVRPVLPVGEGSRREMGLHRPNSDSDGYKVSHKHSGDFFALVDPEIGTNLDRGTQ